MIDSDVSRKFGAGTIRENIRNTNTRISLIIGDIWDSISMLYFRFPLHPDDQYFTRENLRNILNGGEQISKSGDLVKDLIRDSISRPGHSETHLSILHCKDIGCTNPNVDVPAQYLNKNDECDNCVDLHMFEMNPATGNFNPFQCWRRGLHSVGVDISFAAHLELSYDDISSHQWIYSEEINFCLTDSLRLSMPDTNSRSSKIIFSNHLHKRQMVFAITIRATRNHLNKDTKLSEIQQLPEQMLLLQTSYDVYDGLGSNLKVKDMPIVLIDMLKFIVISWQKKSHSKDTLGKPLSIVILHKDGEEICDKIKPKIQQYTGKKIQTYNFSSVDAKPFLEGVGLQANHLEKGDAIVAMCVDPILDLGVKPYGI
jgi:hypothetical protein